MKRFELEKEIKQNGYTIEGFASEIGMSRTTFWRKLNGESEFDISEAKQICTVLGINDPTPIFFDK